jgi:hypothetical protein
LTPRPPFVEDVARLRAQREHLGLGHQRTASAVLLVEELEARVDVRRQILGQPVPRGDLVRRRTDTVDALHHDDARMRAQVGFVHDRRGVELVVDDDLLRQIVRADE